MNQLIVAYFHAGVLHSYSRMNIEIVYRCKLSVTYVYCCAQFLCIICFDKTSNHKDYTYSCPFSTCYTTIIVL